MSVNSVSPIPSFSTVEQVIEELKPGYPVYCLRPAEIQRQAKYFLETFSGRVLCAVKLDRLARLSQSQNKINK